ncbi:protein FAM89A-like [Anneissia japonica]|uniref:protein FAM89A-like n=1 Tax=Anneissia japonica TaxID=1529436 RepID=UPI0014257569|nr:protein FAM89A-like [Anneissia japonica]
MDNKEERAVSLKDLPGLPELPKSLSGLLNVNSGTWRETGRIHAHKANIQHNLVAEARRKKTQLTSIPPGNLDAGLALLRKEMVGLRQLDMSLLCQLWSLHESIQEYKSMLSAEVDMEEDDTESVSSFRLSLSSTSSYN